MVYDAAYWDTERYNLLKTLILSRIDILTNEESRQFKIFYNKFVSKMKHNTAESYEKTKLMLKQLPFCIKLPESDEILKQTKQMTLKFYITLEDVELFKICLKIYLNFLQKQNFTKMRKIKTFQHDLPIAAFKNQILYLLNTHPVIIVAGDTGCGKSTQVPQFLLHAGFKNIACTQPRRIACISLAKRVSFETLNEFGHDVAYHVRFDTNKIENTKILFLTEGLLLRQFQVDPKLSQYNVIIVDEVHERHLNSDFLLGILKCLTHQRNDLKIILMSATINANLFSSYFDGAPLIQVPGRLHPITLEYIPEFAKKDIIIKENTNKFDPIPYMKVLQMIDQKYPTKEGGDLLIFLNGVKEINQVVDAAIKYAETNKQWIVLPLHSNLSLDQQDKVFDYAPDGMRKCIVSTNIAETSLTIDGIRFVCDSGKVNEMAYNPTIKLRKLVEMWISKSSAEQRKGRAGRTGPGICYRMYSENDYEDFDDFPIPEIKRADLNSLVLQMMSLGLNDPLAFTFIEQPETSGINCALKDLKIRKAIAPDNTITFLGRALASLPLEPSVGAILLYGSFLDMVTPSLIHVAALGIQTPFNQSFSGRCDFKDKYLGEVSENFVINSEGDPFILLKCFAKWLHLKRSEKSKFSTIWCRKLGIMERRFYDMVQLCNQFKRLLNSLSLTHTQSAKSKIKLTKSERSELENLKDELMNQPRKRKLLSANINIDDTEDDFTEMDVKEVEFRLARSGSVLGDVPLTDMPLEDKILYSLSISLGLYPQFAIPDDSNEFRKDSEQFFHTKDKQFLSMHPNSFFGLYPEILRNKLSAGKQPWMVVYVGLLETTKPYLLNTTKIPAVPTLMLTCELDTDLDCTKIVADGWLEMKFQRPQDALQLLCSAISIRNSFAELIEFYFSSNADNFDEKYALLQQLHNELIEFFHRDIECCLKYILNADRQVMYRRSVGDTWQIPADLLLMTAESDIESKANLQKGGYSLTSFLTYGSLIDPKRHSIDESYLQIHFTCPTCEVHLVCTPTEQFMHANNCKPVVKVVPEPETSTEITDPNASNRVSYTCETCNQTLLLTLTEILRHKKMHINI